MPCTVRKSGSRSRVSPSTSVMRGKRLHGEPVRELQIEAVEKRFGTVETVHVDHRQEFFGDNGMPQRFVNRPT